ncbi:hypothetical protein SLS59_004775 [Nothophoma quercina]|uniref:Uncharacterized protein n=1 Tax=Nothophoma quercina TaxID=749835 RepID=A0ABR3RGV5_9PLEO
MSLFGPAEVAFVTGAASGIGRATALQFVADGIRQIFFVDISMKGLDETVALIETKFRETKVEWTTADVSIATNVDYVVSEPVKAFGRIDYCVNSAGTGGPFGRITEQDERTLDKTFNINVKGIWLCERAQIAQMLKQDLRLLK